MKTMTISSLILCILSLTACIHQMGHNGSSGKLAYVTNEKDANLMVVDLQREEVVATLPTGKIPHALVFTPNGKGYVNNRGEHSLTVIDAAAMSVIKTIPLPATSMQIALSPDSATLAVGYKDALKITLIDTATDTIRTTLDIGVDRPGKKPVRIKHPFWSQDGRSVYAGDNLNMTVVKIDAVQQKIVATIPVNATTHHFMTAPDGTIWAANGKTRKGKLTITVLDAVTNMVLDTISIPMVPGEKAKGHHGTFSPDGKQLYFCNEGGRTLAIIDTSSRKVVKTLQVGHGAGHAYFSRDGKKAYIVNHHDNMVSVIDTDQQEIIKNIQVGNGKKEGHSGYVADDGSFYMLNAADGTVNRIDGKSLTRTSSIKVGNKSMIMVVR